MSESQGLGASEEVDVDVVTVLANPPTTGALASWRNGGLATRHAVLKIAAEAADSVLAGPVEVCAYDPDDEISYVIATLDEGNDITVEADPGRAWPIYDLPALFSHVQIRCASAPTNTVTAALKPYEACGGI